MEPAVLLASIVAPSAFKDVLPAADLLRARLVCRALRDETDRLVQAVTFAPLQCVSETAASPAVQSTVTNNITSGDSRSSSTGSISSSCIAEPGPSKSAASDTSDDSSALRVNPGLLRGRIADSHHLAQHFSHANALTLFLGDLHVAACLVHPDTAAPPGEQHAASTAGPQPAAEPQPPAVAVQPCATAVHQTMASSETYMLTFTGLPAAALPRPLVPSEPHTLPLAGQQVGPGSSHPLTLPTQPILAPAAMTQHPFVLPAQPVLVPLHEPTLRLLAAATGIKSVTVRYSPVVRRQYQVGDGGSELYGNVTFWMMHLAAARSPAVAPARCPLAAVAGLNLTRLDLDLDRHVESPLTASMRSALGGFCEALSRLSHLTELRLACHAICRAYVRAIEALPALRTLRLFEKDRSSDPWVLETVPPAVPSAAPAGGTGGTAEVAANSTAGYRTPAWADSLTSLSVHTPSLSRATPWAGVLTALSSLQLTPLLAPGGVAAAVTPQVASQLTRLSLGYSPGTLMAILPGLSRLRELCLGITAGDGAVATEALPLGTLAAGAPGELSGLAELQYLGGTSQLTSLQVNGCRPADLHHVSHLRALETLHLAFQKSAPQAAVLPSGAYLCQDLSARADGDDGEPAAGPSGDERGVLELQRPDGEELAGLAAAGCSGGGSSAAATCGGGGGGGMHGSSSAACTSSRQPIPHARFGQPHVGQLAFLSHLHELTLQRADAVPLTAACLAALADGLPLLHTFTYGGHLDIPPGPSAFFPLPPAAAAYLPATACVPPAANGVPPPFPPATSVLPATLVPRGSADPPAPPARPTTSHHQEAQRRSDAGAWRPLLSMSRLTVLALGSTRQECMGSSQQLGLKGGGTTESVAFVLPAAALPSRLVSLSLLYADVDDPQGYCLPPALRQLTFSRSRWRLGRDGGGTVGTVCGGLDSAAEPSTSNSTRSEGPVVLPAGDLGDFLEVLSRHRAASVPMGPVGSSSSNSSSSFAHGGAGTEPAVVVGDSTDEQGEKPMKLCDGGLLQLKVGLNGDACLRQPGSAGRWAEALRSLATLDKLDVTLIRSEDAHPIPSSHSGPVGAPTPSPVPPAMRMVVAAAAEHLPWLRELRLWVQDKGWEHRAGLSHLSRLRNLRLLELATLENAPGTHRLARWLATHLPECRLRLDVNDWDEVWAGYKSRMHQVDRMLRQSSEDTSSDDGSGGDGGAGDGGHDGGGEDGGGGSGVLALPSLTSEEVARFEAELAALENPAD